MGHLADSILEYLDDDEVQLLPDDPENEHRENTWAYGVDPDNPSTRAEVVAAINTVVAGLRVRWNGGNQRGRFYTWYDEMSGCLKCSVTSQERFPFRCDVVLTEDLSEVIDEALSDSSPGLISWDDLVEVEPGDEAPDEPIDVSVLVWATPVP